VKSSVLVLMLGTALSVSVSAQNQVIDETKLVTLHGTVHPLALPQYDQGRISDSFPMHRLLLTVKRPADREKDLQQFLQDVHSPGSPAYHKWLTPDEYGTRFGALDEDTQVVSAWLQTHGFSVSRVTRNKSLIEFFGTAGQIREALHTEMHQYSEKGEDFYDNAGEISVPQAIASRIGGFAPLNRELRRSARSPRCFPLASARPARCIRPGLPW
jgi:subtilase family serine protease